MRRFPVAALAALAVTVSLVLGACSSGGSKSPSAALTSTTVTAPPRSSAPAGTRAAGANPFCDFVQAFADRFGRLNSDLTDPQQLRSTLLDAANVLKDGQSKAPDNLKADVAVLNDAFQRLIAIFQQAGFDITKVDPASLNQLQAPQFTAASDHLQAYMRQNCL